MDTRIDEIKKSKTLTNFNEILMPGEREFGLEKERRKKGIPLIDEVFTQLKEEARKNGVNFNF